MKAILGLFIISGLICGAQSPPTKAPTAKSKPLTDAAIGTHERKTPTDWVTIPENKPAPSGNAQVGRYQIVFSPNARADTFMLDTQTGKVWQFVTYTDSIGNPHAWTFVPRLDNQPEQLQFEVNLTLKTDSKEKQQ